MAGVRSVCPKCGREGAQSVYRRGNANYLRFIHGSHDVCYIGRIKRGGEGLGEFNRPQSLEDYEKAMEDVTKEIRKLVGYYSPDSATRWKSIAPRLLEIVEKYGY
jgi:hypothetical protein